MLSLKFLIQFSVDVSMHLIRNLDHSKAVPKFRNTQPNVQCSRLLYHLIHEPLRFGF